MANHSLAELKTLKWEGGYCDVKGDAGGETIFGIARNSHADSVLWSYVDEFKSRFNPFTKANYKALEELCMNSKEFCAEMARIYKSLYWDKIRGDEIDSQDVANALYDFAVNSGVKRASQYIQRLVNVEDDGVIGAKTIEAINSKNGSALCNLLCDERVNFLREIAKKPNNSKFLKGWLDRVSDFYAK